MSPISYRYVLLTFAFPCTCIMLDWFADICERIILGHPIGKDYLHMMIWGVFGCMVELPNIIGIEFILSERYHESPGWCPDILWTVWLTCLAMSYWAVGNLTALLFPLLLANSSYGHLSIPIQCFVCVIHAMVTVMIFRSRRNSTNGSFNNAAMTLAT